MMRSYHFPYQQQHPRKLLLQPQKKIHNNFYSCLLYYCIINFGVVIVFIAVLLISAATATPAVSSFLHVSGFPYCPNPNTANAQQHFLSPATTAMIARRRATTNTKIRIKTSKQPTTRRRRRRTRTHLSMALVPLPVEELTQCLALGVPNGEQYSTYWGQTSRERFNAIFESFSVTFLGVFASYFLSFVIGTPLATLLGAVAAFWVLLGPELKAYQRNWELLSGRILVDPWMMDNNKNDRDYYYDDDYDGEEYYYDSTREGSTSNGKGLYGALYVASIVKAVVVENPESSVNDEYELSEFDDYTMENDEKDISTGIPWMLRLSVKDTNNRCMQIHARLSEEYLDIQKGMPCVCILLSTDVNFSILSGLTEFFIPNAGCYVGDYPYLSKSNFGVELEERGLLHLLDEEEENSERILLDDDDDDDDVSPSSSSSSSTAAAAKERRGDIID